MSLFHSSFRKWSSAQYPFLDTFQRKIKVDFTRQHYQVKTAETPDELYEVLCFRYEIFHREFQGKIFPVGLDVDVYDRLADHLIIRDLRTQKVVGSYRLICSLYSHRFYSQSEFYLDRFLSVPGAKVELSRAGVHRAHRTGAVMSLLWRGVAEYAEKVRAQYLFGCASVKTMSPKVAFALAEGFAKEERQLTEYYIEPTLSYRFQQKEEGRFSPFAEKEQAEWVPPLLKMYFRMGAKVAPKPALDRAFRCIDFFTVLHLGSLDASFQRRYRGT